MRISVIGLGNMGTAIANIIAKNGFDVLGWEYFQEVVDEVNNRHSNSKFLSGVKLDKRLKATTDIRKCLEEKDVIFIALPSAFIRQVLALCEGDLDPSVLIVNLSKGIEEETCLSASDILREIFKENEVVVLSGPSIANEFSKDLPCGVVLAGSNKSYLYKVARIIETQTFRTRFSDDIIGVEWSGILKNIYAIGLGLIDGSGIESINFKSAFITKAIEEMADLIEALGGKRKTVYYLAGLGDLIATSLSTHSHNRKLGMLLAKGFSLEKAQQEMGVLPEGVKTLRVAVYLSEKYHTPMPVARGILGVINGEVKPDFLVKNFMKIGV